MSIEDEGLCVSAGGRRWRLYVRDISRIQQDWFIQIVAIGPRVCTVFVRTDAPDIGASAAPVFHRIREWLATGTLRECVFLDLLAAD